MSDIAPRKFKVPQVPDLPDEVIFVIFSMCDPLTIQAAKSTSRYWKEKLSSYEFVSTISEKLIPLGCSIYAHFGFARTNMATSDWVMKMDPLTGEQSEFLLPFLVINRGWYRIVGVDNGVFCVRYSSFGISSHLLVWNPTTYSSRVIPDPPRHYCKDCSYLYSFAHFPNSINYAVVHIFKQTPDSPCWKLAMYLSLERNWVVKMECPTFVRRLDPCYASLNGVLYWLHWNMEDIDSNPPYIICFCLTSPSFRQISLPARMRAHCHSLLIKDNKLCVNANDHTMQAYRSTFWQANNIHDQPTWSRLYSYNGYGTHYLPASIIDDEIIQVM
ncbi:hypothetical protein PIB30_024908 [Stylosanthes scabra]|uniref:F-box domain-containing protein n=1 Tax=Stylosanthes scabra TaxID=79078 RepID=A0ABU6S9F1_9FABA|nr:hypothetical protein [Stylosanthes scabra]